MKISNNQKKCISIYSKLIIILIISSSNNLLAQVRSDLDIGDVVTNIGGSFHGILTLLFGICVVAGLLFAVAAIFKFKQHKDNPSQITMGQPIGLLFLGACMIWLPYIIQSLGATITGAQTAEELGSGMSKIGSPGKTKGSGFNKFMIPEN